MCQTNKSSILFVALVVVIFLMAVQPLFSETKPRPAPVLQIPDSTHMQILTTTDGSSYMS